MKTIIAVYLINILGLTAVQSPGGPGHYDFSPAAIAQPYQSVITFNDCSIRQNRVWLNWTVANNQRADRFEIEKSSDGKNFTMTALVFGTDQAEACHYQFYEKAKSGKLYYRIKVLYKDNGTAYSETITVKANKTTTD